MLLLSDPAPQTAAILTLDDPAAVDPRVTGGKAAALAALAGHHPVPAGFVVVGDAPANAILAAYAALGDGGDPAVAVRSSATDEDGVESSFAGLHETILGVRGGDALLAAVAEARASGTSERALAYRRDRGIAAPDAALPVLVQLLVPADAAGVVFSRNPVAAHRPEVLINASLGLGESVVGGTVTPDAWTVARPARGVTGPPRADQRRMTVQTPGGTVEVDIPAPLRRLPSIDDAQARAAAALAVALERELGLPVDLEVAWSGGHLHLLQCRPITTLSCLEAAA
jgi:phosphoenolpyruvate synthase/pyruvate phosphate dikinase